MKLTAAAFLVAVLFLSTSLPILSKKNDRDAPGKKPEKPKLALEALPRMGFSPLQLTLRATLSGVSRDDDNFCHVDKAWLGKRSSDPYGRERASTHRPRCHHPDDERHVQLRYYKDLTLYSPGAYTYRLKLQPKKGPAVVSNPITIQVLKR